MINITNVVGTTLFINFWFLIILLSLWGRHFLIIYEVNNTIVVGTTLLKFKGLGFFITTAAGTTF
jgi:hypothetical protein